MTSAWQDGNRHSNLYSRCGKHFTSQVSRLSRTLRWLVELTHSRRDDATTRRETLRVTSTGSARWRRRARAVAGVRVERITSGQSDEPAVCDSLDPHSCNAGQQAGAPRAPAMVP
jgi:hypothetical protein